jgi:hypothetical protein
MLMNAHAHASLMTFKQHSTTRKHAFPLSVLAFVSTQSASGTLVTSKTTNSGEQLQLARTLALEPS